MSVPSLPVGCATSVRACVMAFTLLETPKSPSGPAASVAAATPQKRRRSKSRVVDIACLPRTGHLVSVMSGLPSNVASCPVAIADVLHAVDGSRGDVGEGALGPRTEQQSLRAARIAFDEPNGHAVDDAKGRLASDLAQTLVWS